MMDRIAWRGGNPPRNTERCGQGKGKEAAGCAHSSPHSMPVSSWGVGVCRAALWMFVSDLFVSGVRLLLRRLRLDDQEHCCCVQLPPALSYSSPQPNLSMGGNKPRQDSPT
ncbi:techylectin-5A-like [Platysternon megacephalum]|uniref:Techylectin-5A-like n=1 Tax=Platysternon megacephalum TaxID=55544 RepID=A0A4D9DR35_9SAUR|nr:techylectin-5A-like [Platysternon megacephalum]